MARVKPKRHGVVTDMTAMCDVAFLLLTFFILTTQFKQPDAEQITTPSSVSEKKLDDKDSMSINVTNDGRYYFSPINNPKEKAQLLDAMGEKFGVKFTPEEKVNFQNTQFIGVSMAQMKSFLQLPEDKRKAFKGGTVPMDSTNKQLIDWVSKSLEINPEAKLAIKGDGAASYDKFKTLFEGLRDIEFYKFVLITNTEKK